MKKHLINGDGDKSFEIFNKILKIIDFHAGSFHPMHIFLYKLIALFYEKKNMYKDAIDLYNTSLSS